MRLLSTGGGDFHGSILPPSLCFTLTCLLLFYASASSSISEKSVLLELKSSVSDPEGVLSSWISRNSSDGLEHCSWYGVVCGADSRVSALTVGGGGNWGFGSNLEKVPFVDAFKYPFYDSGAGRTSSGGRNGRLIGALPSAMAKLTEIRVLSLPSLGFTGEIPADIWVLQKLEVLNLEGNSFTGNLPVSFEGLRKLRVLNLGFNHIGGGIPDLLSRCVKLEVLNLAGNRFRGPIPKFIGRFPKLSGLLLSKNNLTGEIPHTFGQLQKLKVLDVSSNSLSGPVPGELGKCTDLSVLVLSGSGNGKGNSFQGTIPTEITSLLKLKVLWAPCASLKGEFPSNWGESLEVLNLSHNFFTGELIRVFEVCKSLIYVDLSSNKLTGPLDRKLHVPCMVVFDVSKNMLSGAIPRFSNGGVCPPVNLPKVLYLQQFDDAPTVNVKLAVIHNFGQNNFTGAIPSLPIARSRLVESADYAFLADGNKLTGSFPGRLFESCHKLNGMFVKVNNNRLSGPVPVALGAMCRSLKFLDASGNRIYGFIPQSLGDKESMVLVDLQQKDGHAEIPLHLGWLNRLYYYSLSKDMLQGVLPCRLRRFLPIKVFSLDSGSLGIENLPGGTMELRNLTAVVFNFNELSLQIHTDLSDGKPLARRVLSDATDVQTEPDGAKFNSIEIASIVSASAIVLVLLALIVLFIYTRKYAPKGGSRVQVLEKREITTFTNIGVSLTFQNIVKATESFSTRNCIGSGGFGTTYRAEVSPGVLVAVKRLAVGRFHCVQQFHAEIKTLGGIRHQNLVTLIGYHASETEMFLVYNYLPGGNLEKFIKDRSTRPVSWKVLHKIALDVAHALAYLHDSCDQRIIHRDVKPSNILLDNDFNAYLSDFGLSRLLGDSETHATTGVEGTFGYLAPEYAMTCRVSEKADVYSYGVVLLELISDKKALDPSFSAHGDGFNIVSWACMLLRQGRAKEVFTTGLWDSGPRDDLVEVLHLAVKCTLETLSIRPTMKQVVSRLKQLRPVS